MSIQSFWLVKIDDKFITDDGEYTEDPLQAKRFSTYNEASSEAYWTPRGYGKRVVIIEAQISINLVHTSVIWS